MVLTGRLNAVCNDDMHSQATATHEDADRIKAMGGPTKVAAALGYDKLPGGVQRVSNWRKRGIPAQVKLDYPHLFLVPMRKKAA